MRALATLMVLGWLSAGAVAQPPAAADLVWAFVQAWNAHDGERFGPLYADDADWVTVGGDRLEGRAAVVQALTKEHATWARLTTLVATDVRVRELDAGRAVVMFTWEIARDADRGASRFRGHTMLVAAKGGQGWVILAGQAAAVPSN